MVLPRCSAGPGDPGVSGSFRTLHRGRPLQSQALQNPLLEPGQHHRSGQLLHRAALSQALDPEMAQDEDRTGHHDWDAARPKTQAQLQNIQKEAFLFFSLAWTGIVSPQGKCFVVTWVFLRYRSCLREVFGGSVLLQITDRERPWWTFVGISHRPGMCLDVSFVVRFVFP